MACHGDNGGTNLIVIWEVQDGGAEMMEGEALEGLSKHVSQYFISQAVFDHDFLQLDMICHKEVANVNVVHPMTARALAILFQ